MLKENAKSSQSFMELAGKIKHRADCPLDLHCQRCPSSHYGCFLKQNF